MTECNPECSIAAERRLFPEIYQEGIENGLLMRVLEGLSARMAGAVRGTKGLTDTRIEEILLEDISAWRADGDSEEADYLEAHPELATAVYHCEWQVQLGNCAVRSTN